MGLVKFYAAWCPASRNVRDEWRQVAQAVEDLPVEVGAVNCVRQPRICGEYVAVSKYPTVMMLNREFGTLQQFSSGDIKVAAIREWAERVAREWQWLFRYARVHWDLGRTSFTPGGNVADSSAMWVVAFIDGRECASCKATCTNILRLSASLAGLPVETGVVDCSLPEHQNFCYEEHEVPKPPHRPLTKAWRAGIKNRTDGPDKGELLYGVADLEPHIAFQLVEKAVRLALADRTPEGGLVDGVSASFEGEPPEDSEPPPAGGGYSPPPRRPSAPVLQWGDGAQAHQRALPKPWNSHGQENVPGVPLIGR